MNAPQCPQCRVAMNEGFVPDLGHFNVPVAPKWTEGAPQPSFWQGLDLRHKDRYAVATYRCPSCGLLQSYARAT